MFKIHFGKNVAVSFSFLSSYSIACVVTNGSAQHVGQTGAEDIHSHSILNRVWKQLLKSLCHFKRATKLFSESCFSIISILPWMYKIIIDYTEIKTIYNQT